ncbi:MAG: DUF2892 domain-containing protein [Bacteriovoracaceae bacterium]|nr:DUF2892 domain-containing protein [Bacteriovoracaceae bacterium]
MKKNINDYERIIRFLAGVILTSMAFIGPANLWFLLGIIPLLTGLVGTCPLYSLLGMSSRKDDSTSSIKPEHYIHKSSLNK